MYNLKTFAGALTLATAKPTRRYFSVTAEQGRELTHFINHVVANAAQIALGGPALVCVPRHAVSLLDPRVCALALRLRLPAPLIP